jgi:ethanolamine permease
MSSTEHQHGDGHRVGADFHAESSDYLAKRTLKRGTAGWLLLAGLGVSYVISGDYSGWNFGLAEGGFGGLLIASVVIAGMYLAMVLGMAEMSSALPAAGGGYTFARRALGPWGGFATGTAILIEYAIAPAAIATFIGAYVESLGLFGITDGWWVYLAAYVLFIGIHLAGVGEALKVMFVITVIALAGLVIFAVSAIGSFDAANLTDIAPTDAAGASAFLPFGYLGIWAAVPFAIWFFLAIEGVPLAAEEAKEPERNVPKGIIAGMGALLVTAVTVLFLVPGAGGAKAMSESGNPLVEALGDSTMATVVNYIGLAGLIASFFSIIYAYSRLLFALSRAGYLPRAISVVNSRKAPMLALVVPGVIGFVLSLTGQGAMLLNMAVFGAALSYVLMMVSHIVLRVREPGMPRPYRTPGGIITTSFALVVAALSVVATFVVDSTAAFWCLVVFAAFMAYFAVYSRHHLVANTPDEEFAALAAAEEELE